METKKTLIDAFNLFISTDVLRAAFQLPLEQDGYVYATDARVLIRTEKQNCDFDAITVLEPIMNAVIPKENCEIKLNLTEEMFLPYKTEDEYEMKGEDVKCKTCEGEGEVEWEFETYSRYFDCPVCNGDGYSKRKYAVKTGNKTFGNTRVKLRDTYFKIDYFYLLLEVQKIIGGDITLLFIDKNDRCGLFRVGFCEIVIMPVLHSKDDDKEYQLLEIMF